MRMKRICLIGPVDKRIISYPLLKCLMLLGKTLVVTDDGVYRRFHERYESDFDFGHSRFIVTPKIDQCVLEKVRELENQYDYILYITTNELPEACDRVVYVRGLEKSICSQDTLDALENIEHAEVLITFDKNANTEAVKITPTMSSLAYVMACEENKEFVDIKDARYASIMFKLFEKELDISEKAIRSIMKRKE